MKRNSTLAKKLKAYSALAGVAAVTPFAAEAQVIYSNIEPDTILAGRGYNSFDLDLNSDGITDFSLTQYYSTSYSHGQYHFFSGIFLTIINDNSGIATTAPGNDNISIFNNGDTIDVNDNWYAASLYSVDFNAQWNGVKNKYIGARVKLNGQNYYGWIRVTVGSNGNSITIKDYAFNATPEAPIIAGDTKCESQSLIPQISISKDSLFANLSGSYQWYLNGLALAGQTNKFIHPDSNGIYNVVVSDASGCNAISPFFNYIACDSLKTMIHGSSLGSNCGSSSLEIIISNPQLAFEYHWQKNNSEISGTSDSELNIAIYENAQFRVIATNSVLGCSDTSNTLSFQVYPLPPPAVIKQTHDSLFCDSIKGVTYQWYVVYNQLITGATNRFFVPTQGFNKYYNLIISDSLGCASISSYYYTACSYLNAIQISGSSNPFYCKGEAVLDTLTVTEFSNCIYKWNSSSNTSHSFIATKGGYFKVDIEDTITHCKVTKGYSISQLPSPLMSEVYLSGNTLIASPSESYQWQFNGTFVAGATNQSFMLADSGVYIVQVGNVYGCTALSQPFLYNTCIPITPKLQLLEGKSICNGDLVRIDVLPENGYYFQWHRNGLPIPSEIKSFLKADTTGIYFVQLTDKKWGCKFLSDTVTINESILVIPKIIQSGDTLKLDYPYNEKSCEWIRNGMHYGFARGLIRPQDGVYFVQLFDSNGCNVFSLPFFYYSVGMNINNETKPFTLFYDEGKIFIRFISESFYNGNIMVYNVLGQKIFSSNIKENLEELKINESQQVLFITVEKDKRIWHQKIFLPR